MTIFQQYRRGFLDLIPRMSPRKKRWFFTGFTFGLAAASMLLVAFSFAMLPKTVPVVQCDLTTSADAGKVGP